MNINNQPRTNGALRIFVDGACGPTNPGPMGIGVTVVDTDGTEIHALSEARGQGTNNLAEWMALIAALEWCTADPSRTGAQIFMDSQLVVRQLAGEYACNQRHLLPFYDRGVQLAAAAGATVSWIPREENERADALSKRALFAILTMTPQIRELAAQSLAFSNYEIRAMPASVRTTLEAALLEDEPALSERLLTLHSGRDAYSAIKSAPLRAAAVLRHGDVAIRDLKARLSSRSQTTLTTAIRWAARGLVPPLCLALVNLHKAARTPYIRRGTA